MLGRNTAMRRHEVGQALVEMAFASLMFLFLFFGIIEFSRALYTYNTIVQSTRAAARWAVVNTFDQAKIQNMVVYGDPDVSSGNPILSGLTTDLVSASVVDLESSAGTKKISVIGIEASSSSSCCRLRARSHCRHLRPLSTRRAWESSQARTHRPSARRALRTTRLCRWH